MQIKHHKPAGQKQKNKKKQEGRKERNTQSMQIKHYKPTGENTKKK